MGGAKLGWEWGQAVAWGGAEHLVEPHSALERGVRGSTRGPLPPSADASSVRGQAAGPALALGPQVGRGGAR